MDEQELRLDGNAAAGCCRRCLFTSSPHARGACAAMRHGRRDGRAAPLHVSHVARRGPALRACEGVLMVIVHAAGRVRLGLQGLVWLEMQDAAAAG